MFCHIDCRYSLNGTIVEKVSNWKEIFLDFSTNLFVIFLNIKWNQRYIVINFQGAPRKVLCYVCPIFIELEFCWHISVRNFLLNLTNSVRRDPNFSTRRDSDREREREKKDGWTDKQVDRNDVAFRNFSNAYTLWEGKVFRFIRQLKKWLPMEARFSN